MDGVKTEWMELQEAADPALYHTVVGAGLSAGDAMQAYMAFMAPRLAEFWRVLKPNGSMYLHCDPPPGRVALPQAALRLHLRAAPVPQRDRVEAHQHQVAGHSALCP